MAKRLAILFFMSLAACGILQASESAPVQYDKANKLFAASRYQEALALYQVLLPSPPAGVSPSDIHTRIGDAWFHLGAYANSLESYHSALKGQNEAARPGTQYWIGFCCLLLGRDAEAAREFLKIPELYPGSGMWVGTGYYWAGRAYERMGRPDEAAACYRKAAGNGRTTQGTFALKKAESVKNGSGDR
jgi:tetratricopeptide (TPR) repeat protein